jgi:MerR family transcriptional regulator, light-induced transcriptional regulator
LYIQAMAESGPLRIGELSRRSGVSPALLRAWERRYGLLRPTRSAGGLRLYSANDLARVQAMQQHLAEGLAAAEAAAIASRDAQSAGEIAPAPAAAQRELAAALAAFDEVGAHAAIDSLLAQVSLDTMLRDVVIPYLHELGDGWERGDVSIAQEHFASSLLRGRLLGLARGWGGGLGPSVVLACAPGEQHDLGLIAFGLALRARAWRIVFVVSSVDGRRFRRHTDELADLAVDYRLCLGGAGAAKARVGDDVLALTRGPVEEAERLTELALV